MNDLWAPCSGLKVVGGVSADLLLGRVDEDKNLLNIRSSMLCFKNTQFLVLLCVLHAVLGLHTFVHAVVLVFVGCLFFFQELSLPSYYHALHLAHSDTFFRTQLKSQGPYLQGSLS